MFTHGATGRVATSIKSPTHCICATAIGKDGVFEIENNFIPMKVNSLAVRRAAKVRVENLTTEPNDCFRLRALVEMLFRVAPVTTRTADSIGNMDVIDSAYRAFGTAAHSRTP